MNINANVYSTKQHRKIKINSILIGVLILANLISNTIAMVIVIPNMFAIVVVLIAIISIVKTGIRLNYRVLLLISLLFIQFSISFFVIDNEVTARFFMAFVSIAIPTIIVSSKSFDIFKVIETIQLVGLLCSPYIVVIIFTEYSVYDSGMLMGLGYSLLPLLVSSIIVIFEKYKKNLKFVALINFILVVFASTHLLSRGYLISFFFLYFIFYFI